MSDINILTEKQRNLCLQIIKQGNCDEIDCTGELEGPFKGVICPLSGNSNYQCDGCENSARHIEVFLMKYDKRRFKASDIQAIIKLIEEGHRNSDYRNGQRQINEAVAMLRVMHEDSHLHSGQRWELSQILECGPLYKDIEKAVKGLKEAQSWQPIEAADMDCFGEILAYEAGNGCIYRTSYSREDGAWLISNTNEVWHPTYWIPLPGSPSLAEPE